MLVIIANRSARVVGKGMQLVRVSKTDTVILSFEQYHQP